MAVDMLGIIIIGEVTTSETPLVVWNGFRVIHTDIK